MGAQGIPRVEDYTHKSQRGANGAARDDARGRQDRVREAIAKPPIRFEWFSDIEPSEDEWLVHEVLPRHGVACIFGGVQSGKSFLAIDWALSIAAGLPVLDENTQRVGVAYVGPEGTAGLRKRIKAWRQNFADKVDERIPFALIPNGLDLRAANAEDVGALIAALQDSRCVFTEDGAPLGLIIVDTFASVTAGMAENSSEGMTAAIGALQRMARETGALVLAVHHTGKDEERGLRGHSSLPAALDTTIEVSHDRESGVHRIQLKKQKDAEGDRTLGAFRRRKVELGTSHNGNAIIGAVIEYEEAPTSVRSKRPPRVRAASEPLLRAIKNALSSDGIAVPKHLRGNIPGSLTIVRRDAVQAHAEKLGLSQVAVTSDADERARTKARQGFGRCIDSLIGQGVIGQFKVSNHEMYVWLCS
jgi:hypothetical protein